MGATKIEWTDAVWNPVTGCRKVSAGCQHCYAERMAKRLAGRAGYPADDPFRVTLHEDRLTEPLRWKKPRRVFVCSMGDLFHGAVPLEFIDKVFAAMALARQHTFMVLTKRPERMAEILPVIEHRRDHVWLGTSIENQRAADERVPHLVDCHGPLRFLSCEPLIGEIVLPTMTALAIDWIIAGGESGPGARPCYPEWIRSLRDYSVALNIRFWFKQWGDAKPDVLEYRAWQRAGRNFDAPRGGHVLDGREWNEYPES